MVFLRNIVLEGGIPTRSAFNFTSSGIVSLSLKLPPGYLVASALGYQRAYPIFPKVVPRANHSSRLKIPATFLFLLICYCE